MEISTDALIAISIIWGFVFIYAVMATMDFGADLVYDLFKQGAYEGHRYCESLFVPDLGGHKCLYCGHRRGAFSVFSRRDICARHRFINSRKHDFAAFSNSKRISFFKHSKGAENAKIYFRHLRLYHSCYFNFGASCDTRRVYRKTDGIYNLNMSKIFSSPNAYSFIGFAILSTLFLSSLLLADVSNVAEEQDAYRAYRKKRPDYRPDFTVVCSMHYGDNAE